MCILLYHLSSLFAEALSAKGACINIYALKVALFLLVYIWSLFLMKQYFWIRNVEGLVMLNKTFISLSFCSELTTTKSPTTITGMFLYLYSHSTYFFVTHQFECRLKNVSNDEHLYVPKVSMFSLLLTFLQLCLCRRW